MNTLTQKANNLRNQLPKNGHGTPPAMKGILLGTLPHKEGEIRLSWDEYEGHFFLSVRLWTTDDGKAFWPSKTGFTVKLKDVPTLADAVSQAVDLALKETKANPVTSHTFEGTDKF
ncbi:MAG: hypothetical protein ACYDAM_10955 [Leptospirales bacterium]